MSMGFGANYADVVEVTFIQETCKKEYITLIETLNDTRTDMGTVAEEIQLDGKASESSIQKAYLALTKAFKKKTGLILSVGYHSIEDNGDRYDEIDGVYWSVEEVWQLTPAGKKYQTRITRQFYVTFG